VVSINGLNIVHGNNPKPRTNASSKKTKMFDEGEVGSIKSQLRNGKKRGEMDVSRENPIVDARIDERMNRGEKSDSFRREGA